MDPHSLAEAVQFGVTGNVYDALVERDAEFRVASALATNWRQTSSTTWRFEHV
jgi:peptide/nickel transport system substrate-binding protein